MTNAAGFPILSLLTWLPLAGGLFEIFPEVTGCPSGVFAG